MTLKLFTLNSNLPNSCQWIMNSKQRRRRQKWLFKVVSVLLNCCQVHPGSFLAQFFPTPCSNLAKTWRNDFLASIFLKIPKFKLIHWWIKEILQLEIKIQKLFDNLGPSSFLTLITFFFYILKLRFIKLANFLNSSISHP